jgi:hypothetical protein
VVGSLDPSGAIWKSDWTNLGPARASSDRFVYQLRGNHLGKGKSISPLLELSLRPVGRGLWLLRQTKVAPPHLGLAGNPDPSNACSDYLFVSHPDSATIRFNRLTQSID